MTVWRIQALHGHGWIRDFWRAPIVTASEDEAMPFDSPLDAAVMAAKCGSGWLVVKREGGEQVKYGEPT